MNSEKLSSRAMALASAAGRMGICFVAGFTALSFLGRHSIWAEISTHFVNLYALSALLGAALIVPARRWGWVAVCLVVFAINGARILPLYIPAAHASGESERVTIVTANVLSSNDRYEAVLTYLRNTDADVLFIQETTARWIEVLRAGLPEYEHVVSDPREDNFGIAVFSRVPLENTVTLRLAGSELPAISGEMVLKNSKLGFVNLHTMPPGSRYGLELRNRQMNDAAVELGRWDGPGIVIGDFNCGPWSPFFADLLEKHGLNDARRGHGVLATWPSGAAPLMIPIDQCLTTETVSVLAIKRGPDIGSDHRPLRLVLAVRE